MWRAYAKTAYELGFRSTEAALRPGRSSARLDDLTRRLHRGLDRMSQEAFDALPGGGAACSPGCDHCCRTLRVTVSPVEVFGILHRLRLTRTSDPALEERLDQSVDQPPRATVDEAGSSARGARGACPLLEEGLCTIYSSRPLACRGCVSADAALCAACDDDRLVPRSMAHQLGAAALAKGVTDALTQLGLAGEPIELRSALTLALRDDDAEKRWLRGDDVFGALGGGDSTQTQPQS